MAVSRDQQKIQQSVKSLLMCPAAIGVCVINQMKFEGLTSNTKTHHKSSFLPSSIPLSKILESWNPRIMESRNHLTGKDP